MKLVHLSLDGLYREILSHLLDVKPIEGYKDTSAEILGANFILTQPTYNLIVSDHRKFNYRYMVAEMLWNAQPTQDISLLTKVFPGVSRFVEDQVNQQQVAWAYGISVWPGLKMVKDELTKDPGSRRAIIRVLPTMDEGTPPCLVSIQFLIRGGKLHAFVNMRSNDVWRGFPLDVYQFTMWQLILAQALGVEVGHYYHSAASFHLYERDRHAAEDLINHEIGCIVSSTPPAGTLQDLLDTSTLNSMYNPDSAGIMHSKAYVAVYHNWYNYMPTEFKFLSNQGYGTGW